MHIQWSETVEYKKPWNIIQIILNIPKENVQIIYSVVTPRGFSSSKQMLDSFAIITQNCWEDMGEEGKKTARVQCKVE